MHAYTHEANYGVYALFYHSCACMHPPVTSLASVFRSAAVWSHVCPEFWLSANTKIGSFPSVTHSTRPPWANGQVSKIMLMCLASKLHEPRVNMFRLYLRMQEICGSNCVVVAVVVWLVVIVVLVVAVVVPVVEVVGVVVAEVEVVSVVVAEVVAVVVPVDVRELDPDVVALVVALVEGVLVRDDVRVVVALLVADVVAVVVRELVPEDVAVVVVGVVERLVVALVVGVVTSQS